MQHTDISAASASLDLDSMSLARAFAISGAKIESHIESLEEHLQPFHPAALLQRLDSLFYDLVDHSAAEELEMMDSGFPETDCCRDHNNDLINTLQSLPHRKVFNRAEVAAELIEQLQSWNATRKEHEQSWSHYKQAQRFRR